MKVLKLFVLFSLFSCVIFSQIPCVPDFKISTSPTTSSSIIQNNAQLFSIGSSGFLITWSDFRNGLKNTYAQQFDATGNPIKTNFPVIGTTDCIAGPTGEFLNANIYSVFSSGYIEINTQYMDGRFFRNGEGISPEFSLGSVGLPTDCWTGFIMPDCSGFYHNGAYYYVVSKNGQVGLTKFSNDGSVVSKFLTAIKSAIQVKGVPLKNGQYGIVWVEEWYEVSKDSIPNGLYMNIYSANDSLIKSKIQLYELPADEYTGGNTKQIFPFNIVANNDSIVLNFVWKNQDSLFFLPVDYNGKILAATQKIVPQFDIPAYAYTSLTVTNAVQYNIDAFLINKIIDKDGKPTSFQTRMYSISPDHILSPVGEMLTATTPCIPASLFQYAPHEYYTAFDSANGIYLAQLKNYTRTNVRRISEQVNGSNEEKPVLLAVGKKDFAVRWNTEQKAYLKMFAVDGSVLAEQREVGTRYPSFLTDKRNLVPWRSGTGVYEFSGFVMNDAAGNELWRDTVKVNGSPVPVLNSCAYGLLSDSMFVTVFQDSTRFVMHAYNPLTGSRFAEKTIAASYSSAAGLSVFRDSDTAFFLGWNGGLQKYTAALQPVGTQETFGNRTYIGGNKFISMNFNQNCQPGLLCGYYVQVHEYGGNDTAFAIPADWGASPFVFPVDDGCYMVIYTSAGKYLSSVYHGAQLLHGPDVFLTQTNNEKDFSVLAQKDRIIVAWADTRSGDYDVWCRIYRRGDLTPVTEERDAMLPTSITLNQNYPNPFNPETMITYSLPKSAYVALKIYSILGKEVKTLVSGEQAAGRHTVSFMAEGLPSGVYMYALQSGSFFQARKMMIVK